MENELHLTDLIDVEMLQRIQDAFSDMTALLPSQPMLTELP